MTTYRMKQVPFNVLLGKTLVEASVNPLKSEILFVTSSGEKYILQHEQECCESVVIEDICGDLADLVGSEILKAEEKTNREYEGKSAEDLGEESCTVLFFTLS